MIVAGEILMRMVFGVNYPGSPAMIPSESPTSPPSPRTHPHGACRDRADTGFSGYKPRAFWEPRLYTLLLAVFCGHSIACKDVHTRVHAEGSGDRPGTFLASDLNRIAPAI